MEDHQNSSHVFFFVLLQTFDQYCLDVNAIGGIVMQEEFEDTKGVIRIRKSMKDRQHNGQKKKDKKTNNDLQNIYIKLKIDYQEPH